MLRSRRSQRRPGWHPDPTGRHQYREWDGSRWTEHVSDLGLASIDPVEQPTRWRSRAAKRRAGLTPPASTPAAEPEPWPTLAAEPEPDPAPTPAAEPDSWRVAAVATAPVATRRRARGKRRPVNDEWQGFWGKSA